jgi:hypothetical protein
LKENCIDNNKENGNLIEIARKKDNEDGSKRQPYKIGLDVYWGFIGKLLKLRFKYECEL